MAIKFKEKRQFERITLKAPLRYQIRGTPEFNTALTNDIGIGGIGFINDKFIAPQTRLALEVNVLSRILSSIGRVARSEPVPYSDRYKIGVEFLEINNKAKEFLSDYVDMQMNRL